MRAYGISVVLLMASASALVAQESVEGVVFAAALDNVRQELQGAPPLNLQHPRDGIDLPADAIVVAQRTIGGAPVGYRTFVDKYFGRVIAEDLLRSYGESGPAPRTIEQASAGSFAILPVEQFQSGTNDYDWQRLNLKYPHVRHVLRLSWPAVDSLGTYAVVRYELIGRDRPSTWKGGNLPWEHASFVKFEKQTDGSWKRTIGVIGAIWN
jgi:hypothetical protein